MNLWLTYDRFYQKIMILVLKFTYKIGSEFLTFEKLNWPDFGFAPRMGHAFSL